MLTSNANLILKYMFQNAKDDDWQLSDNSDGNGPFISAWNREEPIPTDEEINSNEQAAIAWDELKKFTPLICQKAGIVRGILQKYFGVSAEQNRDVTFDAVLNYFLAKQMNGSITTQELADSIVLDKLYAELKTVTPDGTIWTFPWSLLG